MVIGAAEELQQIKDKVTAQDADVKNAMTELNGLRIAVTDANASNIDLDTHHRSFTPFKTLVISLSILLNKPLALYRMNKISLD